MRTLMYHDVVSRLQREKVGFPGPLAGRYKLEPDAFEEHLQAVAATGLRVEGLCVDKGLVEDGPPPQVLLSFDDGGSSALLAAAALERHGWRGHFFITTERIGTEGFLSAGGLRELAERGHAIGSHSHTHPTYMGKLTRTELDREWTLSRQILGEILGVRPHSASVPGGYLSKTVIAAARAAGYELLFTSEPTARVVEKGIVVRGRYTIWATTPADVAAAYARGEWRTCGRLWVEWNAKKLAKSVSPSAYQALRRLRAARA